METINCITTYRCGSTRGFDVDRCSNFLLRFVDDTQLQNNDDPNIR